MNNRAKIITVASMKGGAGKTAITSLLARYLTEIEGKQVLVVDFDGRGGITSLLNRKAVGQDTPSIAEVLFETSQSINPSETFTQAVIHTKMECCRNWRKNDGALLLLPAKPILDEVLLGKPRNLLSLAFEAIGLSNEYLVLIDTGPDSTNASMAIAASDLVFLPVRLSKQDVHPTIETLRAVFIAQRKNNKPILGGMIVNQTINTQWEQSYIDKYQDIFNRFQDTSKLICSSHNLFIVQKQSRIIQRGNHLFWPLEDDFLISVKQMAEHISELRI